MSLDIYLDDEWILNITHNLVPMAEACGLYKVMWRPDENGYEIAGDVLIDLDKAIDELRDHPERYRTFNPPNGWGDYESLLETAIVYYNACERLPKSRIEVSR